MTCHDANMYPGYHRSGTAKYSMVGSTIMNLDNGHMNIRISRKVYNHEI